MSVKARKGDYRAFQVTRTYASLHGSGGANVSLKFERVSKATRDGVAQESLPIFGSSAPTRGAVANQSILKKERINGPAMERALQARGSDEFTSLDELKTFLTPFRRT